MNTLDYLKKLVAIDSHSSTNNTPIIELISSWFKDYVVEIQDWQREDGVEGKNLIVKIPGKVSDQATVFICHVDTVPKSSKWQTDPVSVVEKDEKLFGLGVCDTKGGIAALISATFSLKDKPARDTYLVFDGDEENTGVGLKTFLESIAIKNPQFVAIEPTDGNVLTSQRSIIKLSITTHGVSQHSSQATVALNDRDNAIHKMAKVMHILQEDMEKLEQEKDSAFGTYTQNFGVISGGTAHNVVPDSCTLTMHRRLLPGRDVNKEKDYIHNLLTPIDPAVKVEVIGETQPGFTTSSESAFAKQVLFSTKKQLPNATFAPFIAWSEAGLASFKGESLVLGLGSINQAHNANEFIYNKELAQFEEIFKDILETLVV